MVSHTHTHTNTHTYAYAHTHTHSDIDRPGSSQSLILELYKSKFLFRYELLGSTTVPLYSIRHSNKVSGVLATITQCLALL